MPHRPQVTAAVTDPAQLPVDAPEPPPLAGDMDVADAAGDDEHRRAERVGVDEIAALDDPDARGA